MSNLEASPAIWILSALVASGLIFVLTHLSALTVAQVAELARKRRGKRIKVYFEFDRKHYTINLEFKKRMNPSGQYYPIKKPLHIFPAVAAAMLKYKKHEWIIVAFEKQQLVEFMWVNKGIDRTQVASYLSLDTIARLAAGDGHASVLVLHNHPNPNPSQYLLHKPSSRDLESARSLATVLSSHGVNLIEFVCERGGHHEYARYISDAFYPLASFEAGISKSNGRSKRTNLSLHFERVF